MLHRLEGAVPPQRRVHGNQNSFQPLDIRKVRSESLCNISVVVVGPSHGNRGDRFRVHQHLAASSQKHIIEIESNLCSRPFVLFPTSVDLKPSDQEIKNARGE